MKRILYLILFIVVLVVGLTFALQNSQSVAINYYFDIKWQGPLAVFLLLALAVGSVLGFLASLGYVIRVRHQVNRSRREIRKMEQEITNLRSLPIRDAI
jgi:putative membrane protein